MALVRPRVDWPALARLLAGAAVIAAMVWGPALYGFVTTGGRVAGGLQSAGGPVNVRVGMSFRPQTFQRQELTKYGVFGGIRGRDVVLFNVSQDNLRRLGRLYWVDSVRPFRR
jgi:hypothetical protein